MIEEAVLHHLQGLNELPADIVIPASPCIKDVGGTGSGMYRKVRATYEGNTVAVLGGLEKYPGDYGRLAKSPPLTCCRMWPPGNGITALSKDRSKGLFTACAPRCKTWV